MRTTALTAALLVASCAGVPKSTPVASSPVVVEVPFDHDTRCSGGGIPTSIGYPKEPCYLFFQAIGARPEGLLGKTESEDTVWVEFDLEIPTQGTYRAEVLSVTAKGALWFESSNDSPLGQFTTLVGPIEVDHGVSTAGSAPPPFSPSCGTAHLLKGKHRMRLCCRGSELVVHGVRLVSE